MQGRHIIRIPSVLALALGLAWTAHAQDILPGLWEIKSQMRMADGRDLTKELAAAREQLKSLPPEVRKTMEQQMAGAGVAFGEGGTIRTCLTPEEVRSDVIREGQKEGDCTYTRVSRSGNTWRGRVSCTDPRAEGEFTTTLHSPTHYSTRSVLTSKEDGRTEVDIDARRVSADCGALGAGAAGRRKP